ncbi:hypothetical protein PHLGIDRAFT_80250, partial [Phlebiopsis gigantea 11061_1 CR5-6]
MQDGGRIGRSISKGLPRKILNSAQPARRAKYTNAQGARRRATVNIVPFGVTYEKIGTIQRRLAWPLHKDDTLSR